MALRRLDSYVCLLTLGVATKTKKYNFSMFSETERHLPENTDEINNPKNVFSRGINWDPREPFPPEDDKRAAGPRDVAPYGPKLGHPSLIDHRSHFVDPADLLPDVPRAPRLPSKPRSWEFQEPPNTASIYFPDNPPPPSHERMWCLSSSAAC